MVVMTKDLRTLLEEHEEFEELIEKLQEQIKNTERSRRMDYHAT